MVMVEMGLAETGVVESGIAEPGVVEPGVVESGGNVQQLTEHISDWRSGGAVVDLAERVVRDISLTGLKSKNGYRYTEQSLRESISLYEGKPVFLDHARDQSRPHERSTRDLVGSIVNSRYADGRVRGDIQVLDTESGRTFLALAGMANSSVGMSHVVLAERSVDRKFVEKIHEVVCVDAVVFPATTSFREQAASPFLAKETVAVLGTMEAVLESIDALLPGHVAGLLAEGVSHTKEGAHTKEVSHTGSDSVIVRRKGLFPERLLIEVFDEGEGLVTDYFLEWSVNSECDGAGDALVLFGSELVLAGSELESESVQFQGWGDAVTADREFLVGENRRLQERVDCYEGERREEEHRVAVEKLIEGMGLPDYAVTDLFRQQLLGASSIEECRGLLAERVSVLAGLQKSSPYSCERVSGESAGSMSDRSFVAAVRGKPVPVFGGIR